MQVTAWPSVFLLEVAAETLAQLQAGAQQSRFDGGDAQAECLRSLFGGEVFDVAQGEDGAEAGRQTLNGLAENVAEFVLTIQLLRVGSPLGEVARDGAIFRLDVFVHGDGLAGLTLAQAHKTLVDCDADQPGGELGVALELVQLFVRLEERILRDVFRVLAVLGNVLRYPENLPFVLPNQLLKRRRVTLFCALYERYVGVDLFRGWRLDGWHRQKLQLSRLNRRLLAGASLRERRAADR